MSGPSDEALDAAKREGDWYADNAELRSDYASTLTTRAVEAAHDPALGLNRSVCLRDVGEALRAEAARDPVEKIHIGTSQIERQQIYREHKAGYYCAADFIEREFGDKS